MRITIPADGATFAACPFAGENAFDADARARIVAPAFAEDRERDWVRHPHRPIAGIEPLERWAP